MKRENKRILNLYALCGITAFILVLFAAVASSCRAPEVVYLCESTHVVSSGETLWGICAEYKPESMDMREYVYLCREASGLGDVIYPGDVVTVFSEVTR